MRAADLVPRTCHDPAAQVMDDGGMPDGFLYLLVAEVVTYAQPAALLPGMIEVGPVVELLRQHLEEPLGDGVVEQILVGPVQIDFFVEHVDDDLVTVRLPPDGQVVEQHARVEVDPIAAFQLHPPSSDAVGP